MERHVLIFGATGNIGGATARELLKRNWRVRAVSRTPDSEKSRALANLGAQVVQANMDDRASLDKVFDGMERVLSVQNWVSNGVDAEVRQGKQVAEAAHDAGIQHLVYASAGTGAQDTDIPHFDSKIVVEDAMRALGLPFTVVRPTPFMELLSEKEFFPPLAAWGAKPQVVGWDLPLPWVAVHDLGVAIANIFEAPDKWIGQDISLCGDIRSLRESREVFTAVDGRKPARVPLPLWLFGRMAGYEFIDMWKWLNGLVSTDGVSSLQKMIAESREVCPEMLDMEGWLRMKRNGSMG